MHTHMQDYRIRIGTGTNTISVIRGMYNRYCQANKGFFGPLSFIYFDMLAGTHTGI
jgi:hypothetical protein